jgi:WD40 repeat protein
MDLENRNASLQEEVSMSPTKRAALQTDWVPRAPAAYTLTGHRDQVLRVAFHPSYNIIASASDDSTVKIWDWETGEFERTLKGHTRSVNDVDFDSKGNLLGESGLLHAPCPRLTKPSSHLFVGFVHQSVGHSKRLEERQDDGRT